MSLVTRIPAQASHSAARTQPIQPARTPALRSRAPTTLMIPPRPLKRLTNFRQQKNHGSKPWATVLTPATPTLSDWHRLQLLFHPLRFLRPHPLLEIIE